MAFVGTWLMPTDASVPLAMKAIRVIGVSKSSQNEIFVSGLNYIGIIL